jgi:hypothetical protein
MGDAADWSDIDRFICSAEGRRVLGAIRKKLLGRRFADITFTNETCGVGVTLHLENGTCTSVVVSELDILVLREQFPELLD